MHTKFFLLGIVASCCLTTACVSPVLNETDVPTPAVVSVVDSPQQNYEVQPIVLTIDGRTPRNAGVAVPMDGSGPMDRNYPAGTVIATPALRPAAWSFAVAPGQRNIGLIFAIPGNGLLNWIVNTAAKGSEATGVTLPVMAGCEYQIAIKLTTVGGRDFEPIVRYVRPIPTQMGLSPATSCPNATDVPISLTKD